MADAAETSTGRTWSEDLVDDGLAQQSNGLSAAEQGALRVLVVTDLVQSTDLVERLGDDRARQVEARHDRRARDLVARFGGLEIDKSDGFLLLFERTIEAVAFALTYHRALVKLSQQEDAEIAARAGIHLGEVVLRRNTDEDVARGAKPIEVHGLAKPIAARLMSLAGPGQILVTRGAFDLARRASEGQGAKRLRWLAHGTYTFQGVEDPLEVFEVGYEGESPLAAPGNTEKAHRLISPDGDLALGWRPAVGQGIPGRHHWLLEERLGEGGFGEVWLARHKLGEQRVFKFCFEARQLQSLEREVTLYRILNQHIGQRSDIAKLLDWNFDEPPFFLESEVTPGGNLAQWVERSGGFDGVPLATRLELVAQVADALAAAHSVGVLHKDIKPENILIDLVEGDDGVEVPKAVLTDFGIGHLTNQAMLDKQSITVLGFEDTFDDVQTTGGGTLRYLAPELTEGKVASIQADVYSLGVVLYQMVVGDFSVALAPGWRRNVEDDLLREDIRAAVDGQPEMRLADAGALARRLRSLEERRRQRQHEEQRRQDEQRNRRRLQLMGPALALSLVFVAVLLVMAQRIRNEADRAAEQAEVARRTSDMMVDLFTVSDPFANSDVTARELLDRGAERIPSELEDSPEVLAPMLEAMGDIYVNLGLEETAEPLLRQAVALRRQLEDQTETGAGDLAESLQLLGKAQSSGHKLEEARVSLEEARDLRLATEPRPTPRLAQCLDRLAATYWQLGEAEQAEPMSREAVRLLREFGPEHELALAQAIKDLSAGLWFIGKYDESAELDQEAVEIYRRRLGEQHGLTSLAMQNFATSLGTIGRHDEAVVMVRQAYENLKQLLGASHPQVASAHLIYGYNLHEAGQWEEAEIELRAAMATMLEIYESDHPDLANCRYHLAWVLLHKEQLPEARQMIDLTLATQRQIFDDEHWLLAQSEGLAGAIALRQGQLEAAEAFLLKAYRTLIQQRTVDDAVCRQVIENLIKLYDLWQRPEDAARFRDLLQMADSS